MIPESDGIRFRDSKGGVVELYDITQCENQREPYQRRMTPDSETVVRQELGLPDDRSLLNGLVQRVREPEMIIETMKRLGFPPQEQSAFEMQFNLAVGAILAGRLEIGGSAFTVPVDASVLSRMNDMQRLGFITMAAVTAKRALMPVEQVITDRRKEQSAERMVQNEVRGVSEADGRGNAADPDCAKSDSARRSDLACTLRRLVVSDSGMDDHLLLLLQERYQKDDCPLCAGIGHAALPERV